MIDDRHYSSGDPEDTWVVIRLRDVVVCLGYVLVFLATVWVFQWLAEAAL